MQGIYTFIAETVQTIIILVQTIAFFINNISFPFLKGIVSDSNSFYDMNQKIFTKKDISKIPAAICTSFFLNSLLVEMSYHKKQTNKPTNKKKPHTHTPTHPHKSHFQLDIGLSKTGY